jgi:hypothetical protein
MITIKIRTDNGAFQDGNGGAEVARILRTLADRLCACEDRFTLRPSVFPLIDYNGNTVGTMRITRS